MSTDLERFVCLLEELETSHKLIRAGFGNLQEIDMGNDFYHLPHQLMASGLERLFKCYIALVHQDRTGAYPDMAFMKGLGHDLVNLHNKFCTNYYGGTTRPLVQQELTFVSTDRTLLECIRILSLFGKFGRYYNLDVVAGSPHSPIDPKSEWESLERSLEDSTPILADLEALYHDYYPRIHAKLITKLERLVRAIALQFTIGDHNDQFGKLRQTSVVFTDFRNMRDEQLGTNDYRQSVRILKQEEKNWIKRSEHEIVSGRWPTLVATKEGFAGEWPFRVDRVIVELQESLFAIVNIEGYAFALNGTAASRFKLPFPHDAGMAILGKSVGPFTDMALAMREVSA
jgi:hypothetical protein